MDNGALRDGLFEDLGCLGLYGSESNVRFRGLDGTGMD